MKKRTFGGCVFQRGNKLYLKLHGKQFSTGFNATPKGWELAERMLEEYQFNQYAGLLHRHEYAPSALALFDDMIRHVKSRNKSKKYILGLQAAFKHIAGTGSMDMTTENITAALEQFVCNPNLTDTSKNIYIRHFRAFVNYCIKQKNIKIENNCSRYMTQTKPKNVEPYTETEFSALYSTAEIYDKEFAYLLKFLYLTGFRITETLRLKWDAIDWTEQVISIPNKINKSKIEYFPISDKIETLLLQLSDFATKRRYGKDKVFRWQPETKSKLNKVLSDIETGLNMKIRGQAFHRFRNTFTNKLINADLPMLDVRDLARHASIQTTLNHYKKYNAQKLKSKLNKIFDEQKP